MLFLSPIILFLLHLSLSFCLSPLLSSGHTSSYLLMNKSGSMSDSNLGRDTTMRRRFQAPRYGARPGPPAPLATPIPPKERSRAAPAAFQPEDTGPMPEPPETSPAPERSRTMSGSESGSLDSQSFSDNESESEAESEPAPPYVLGPPRLPPSVTSLLSNQVYTSTQSKASSQSKKAHGSRRRPDCDSYRSL